MMRSSSFLLLAAAGLLLGCGPKSGSRSLSLLPESNEVAKWAKVGETRTFKAADLWQYIDGDADRYIEAGVQETLTANYRYRDSIDAVADIHLMASPAGPKKIMDSESAQFSRPLELGDSGRSFGASLIFREGPYLVRLVAYQQSPETANALVQLAQGIESKLKRPSSNRS